MTDELPRTNPFALLAAYARAAVLPRRRKRKRGGHRAAAGSTTGRPRRNDDGTLTFAPAVDLDPQPGAAAPLDDGTPSFADYLPPPARSLRAPDVPTDHDAGGTPPPPYDKRED